ncbi:MAG: DUF2007 domain-containing protein [Rhodothalassiaceae bacterium]
MRAVIRSNDPALLSFATSLLSDAGIRVVEWDRNMSIADGSIGILPRRLMVAETDLAAARRLLSEAGLAQELASDDGH